MIQPRHLARVLSIGVLLFCSNLVAQTNGYIHTESGGGNPRIFAADSSTGNTTLVGMVSPSAALNAVAWGGSPAALWAINSDREIGTISTATGAFSARRTLPLMSYVSNFEWSATRSEFWIVEQASGPDMVHAYTPATNHFRTIGSIAISGGSPDLAFDASGNLWALLGNVLYLIDPLTLSHRFMAMTDRPFEHFCIDSPRGAFLGIQLSSWSYVELNPATGQTRLLSPVGNVIGELRSWTNVPGICLGRVLSTGTSCSGTAGIDPILEGYGCYGSGGTVHLSLRQAMSGAIGILLFGLGPASIPLGNGCSLNIAPVFADPIIALPLFGTGGAGQGFTSVNFTVPPNTVVSSLALQALVFDVGAPGGFAATNGLRLIVE